MIWRSGHIAEIVAFLFAFLVLESVQADAGSADKFIIKRQVSGYNYVRGDSAARIEDVAYLMEYRGPKYEGYFARYEREQGNSSSNARIRSKGAGCSENCR